MRDQLLALSQTRCRHRHRAGAYDQTRVDVHLRTRLRSRLSEHGIAPGTVGGTRALVHLGYVLRTRRSARASPLRRRYRRAHARARLQLHGRGFLPSRYGRVPHHRMGGTSVRRDQHHCCRRVTLYYRHRIHVHSRPDRTSHSGAGSAGRGKEPCGCMTVLCALSLGTTHCLTLATLRNALTTP